MNVLWIASLAVTGSFIYYSNGTFVIELIDFLKLGFTLSVNIYHICLNAELLCHIFQVMPVLLISLITALRLGWEWHCWYSLSSCWWSTLWAAGRGPMATSLCERRWIPKPVRLSLGLKRIKACTASFCSLSFFTVKTVWRLQHSLLLLNTLIHLKSYKNWINQSWIDLFKVNNTIVTVNIHFKILKNNIF